MPALLTSEKPSTPYLTTSCGSTCLVQGKMLDALESYYANVRVCVDIPGVGSSSHFDSTLSVKQGCLMSPTLFGLYIDQLEHHLQAHNQDAPKLTPKSPFSCMLMMLSFCLSRHQVCKRGSMFYSCSVPKASFSQYIQDPGCHFQ